MSQIIHHTYYFSQSPEEVWEYLTKPELIEQWIMKNDFQPIVGHQFKFTFTTSNKTKYEGVVECKVLEVKPFTKLVYTWNGNTKDKTRAFLSKVEWTLIPKDQGTELHLRHDGFTVLEDILTHEEGWLSCLNRLNESINKLK